MSCSFLPSQHAASTRKHSKPGEADSDCGLSLLLLCQVSLPHDVDYHIVLVEYTCTQPVSSSSSALWTTATQIWGGGVGTCNDGGLVCDNLHVSEVLAFVLRGVADFASSHK